MKKRLIQYKAEIETLDKRNLQLQREINKKFVKPVWFNKEELEKCYLEEKENLLKRLNEILQIENLPDYDDIIDETDKLLNL